MKITRTVNLLLIIFLIIIFAACNKHKNQALRQQSLEVAINVSPVNLDPRITSDAIGSKINQLIFNGLVKFDENMNIIPDLATDYEVINNTTYKFNLRKDVFFHSGNAFTSKDVVYTYKTIVNGEIISPFREAFSRIKKIKAEDDYTVIIELKEPYAPFLTLVTRGIISQADMPTLVGTGAYKLKKFVPESVVNLEKNENFYNKKPLLKYINLHVVKEDNIRVLKMLKGDIDIVQNGIPYLLISKVLENNDLKMISKPGINMTYMGLNLSDNILKNKMIRKAIAHAINKEEIIKHSFNSLAKPANSFLPTTNWAYSKELSSYNYDPKKAEDLLEKAGFPMLAGKDYRFELVYKTSVLKERVDIANMIAHQLLKVGIKVKVSPYEWGTFYRDIKTGNFQIYTLSWVNITEPDIFYDVCNSENWPPKGVNRNKYKNNLVDELTVEGRVSLDVDNRKNIYNKVQQIVLDELPSIPLWYETNVVIYKKELKDVKLRPDGSFISFVDIYKE